MSDLRIVDAPELTESEVQEGLKLPTGGFGNKAINMRTLSNWVVSDKDLVDKGYVDTVAAQNNNGLNGHVNNKSNPHNVTRDQIGLGNVNNTADLDKPVSNAVASALNLKADKTQLEVKADKSTTYTKTEVDSTIDDLYQSLEDNFVANGAALPYDPQVTYNDGAIVVDNGILKKVEGGTLVNAVDAESVSVGDITLDVFAKDVSRYTPLPYDATKEYAVGERVTLTTGDIVQNTVGDNTNDPNVDMTGWSFESPQLKNDLISFFTSKELKDWMNDPENYDVSDILIRYQTLAYGGEMQFPAGTFKITKAIPSTKNWVGVRGAYSSRSTKVIVDSDTPIGIVIPNGGSGVGIELHDIRFESRQKTHTLYRQGSYQTKHSGLRVQGFDVGIDESGTYDYFEDCYFTLNNIGVKSRAIAETGTDVQSTMWGFNRCFFVYNDIGIDTRRNYNNGSNEDLMNILLTSCGFEKNRIGYNAPTRNWYLTFQNCWFEDNSEYGLYAPNSDVIELNTRHNANSPKSVGTDHLEFLPWRSKFSELQASVLKGRDDSNLIIDSDLEFKATYQDVTTEYVAGKVIKQIFGSPSGNAAAAITFYRTPPTNSTTNNTGSAIRFGTRGTANSATPYVDRWELSPSGNLTPLLNNQYNIGEPNTKLGAVYTTKIMYTSTVGDFFGSGSPEGVVSAGIGSTYRRVDGSTGTCFYVKESGTGSTGWIAK